MNVPTFSPWRWWWHDCTTNSSNSVVDDRCMCLYFFIICQIEPFFISLMSRSVKSGRMFAAKLVVLLICVLLCHCPCAFVTLDVYAMPIKPELEGTIYWTMVSNDTFASALDVVYGCGNPNIHIEMLHVTLCVFDRRGRFGRDRLVVTGDNNRRIEPR